MVWEARNWWLCPAQEASSPRRWPHHWSHRRGRPIRAATVPLKAAAATGRTPLQGGPAPATLTCNMMRTCNASLPGCRSLWRRFQREWQLWRNDWVARSSSCHHHQRTKLQKSQKQEPQPQKSHPTRTGWNAPESQGSSTSFIRNIMQLIVKKNFDTSPWNKFWYHYSVIQCYFIRFHPSCTWK